MPTATRSIESRALRYLVLTALLAIGCVTKAPLVDPQPISAAGIPADTRTAILRTLVQSNYTVESDQPGRIVAHTGATDWKMVVALEYAEQVFVRYVSSENLDYDTAKGAPRIHPGYNKRVLVLSHSIAKEIALMNATRDLPVASPPPADSNAPQ